MSLLKEYQLTEHFNFRISKNQKETFDKLKYKYFIDISEFIRIAIKEKIEKEYPILKEKIKKTEVPF